MKKEYPVGNWFPSPIIIAKIDGSIDRTEDLRNSGGATTGFEVTYQGDNKYRVTGSGINNIFIDEEEFILSSSSTHTIWCKITFTKDGTTTGASLTTTDPNNDTDTQGSFIVANIYSGNIVQVASGGFNAISAGVRKEYYKL